MYHVESSHSIDSDAPGAMTTEFDLGCATCGGRLQERSVAAATFGVAGEADVAVAVCAECGERYVPEGTLDRLGELRRT